MAIAWLNQLKLGVSDLSMIHGLLCKRKGDPVPKKQHIVAPQDDFWKAEVAVEWGVPVVVISHNTERRNWRGKLIWEESRITLDALAKKIDDMSESVWQTSTPEFERLLGLDIREKLAQFEGEAQTLFRQSRISRVFRSIRSFFSSESRNYMNSMEFNFRKYRVQDFRTRFVKQESEFEPGKNGYKHEKADTLFTKTDVEQSAKSRNPILAKIDAINERAMAVYGDNEMQNNVFARSVNN